MNTNVLDVTPYSPVGVNRIFDGASETSANFYRTTWRYTSIP
jgi:hypothetical protein